MAVEDIVNYIEENKGENSVQDLIEEIRKSGYPDSEILGAIEILKQRRASGVDGKNPESDIMGIQQIKKEGSFLLGVVSALAFDTIVGVIIGLIVAFIYSRLLGTPLFNFVGYQIIDLVAAGAIDFSFYYYFIKTKPKRFAEGFFYTLVVIYVISVLYYGLINF